MKLGSIAKTIMFFFFFQRARYSRPMYACGPEYDEPACCAPEDEQYTGAYGTPYSDHYGSRPSIGKTVKGNVLQNVRLIGKLFYRNLYTLYK